MALELGDFGKQIRNTLKGLKCAEEGWGKLVGPIV
jgi:hypothetical protein